MLGHGCVQHTHIFFTNPRPLILPPLIITPCTPTSFTATAFLHQQLWIKNTHAQNHHHKKKAAAPTKTSAQKPHPQTPKCRSQPEICHLVFLCVLLRRCWCKKAVAVKDVGVQGVSIKGGSITWVGVSIKVVVLKAFFRRCLDTDASSRPTSFSPTQDL